MQIVFAGERVRANDLARAASIDETEGAASSPAGPFQVVSLETLVRMKLSSFRLKDQVHLQDMIEAELVDGSWPARFAPELAQRLQAILDNPDG